MTFSTTCGYGAERLAKYELSERVTQHRHRTNNMDVAHVIEMHRLSLIMVANGQGCLLVAVAFLRQVFINEYHPDIGTTKERDLVVVTVWTPKVRRLHNAAT